MIPHRMCDSKEKSELVGLDLVLLGVLSLIYPLSSQDEMVMYIYSEGGGVYSRQLISLRLAELNVSYKKVSVEAYAAFTPRNLRRKELFWTRGLPLGKVGVERRKLIDVDEFAMEHKN